MNEWKIELSGFHHKKLQPRSTFCKSKTHFTLIILSRTKTERSVEWVLRNNQIRKFNGSG